MNHEGEGVGYRLSCIRGDEVWLRVVNHERREMRFPRGRKEGVGGERWRELGQGLWVGSRRASKRL